LPETAFRFSSEFQRKIVRLACEDDAFANQAFKHIREEWFESDSLRWAWQQIRREREMGRVATLLVLHDRIRDVPQVLQPRYQALVTQMEQDIMREDAYIRERLAEFIQRAIFAEAFLESRRLFNMGAVDQAITLMQEESSKAHRITFDAPDRSWHFAEWQDRQRERRYREAREWEHTYATGITTVDSVLDGGLSKGELGVWIADSKGGKSIFLVHLAAYSSRTTAIKVLFVVLEGSRFQVQNRLDSLMTRVPYKQLKRGDVDPVTFRQTLEEFEHIRRQLVVRGMTSDWNYKVSDIRAEMDELKAQYGWVPDQLVVDYGDLLRSERSNASEEEHQRDAFANLKTLSTQDRGYSIWTASQTRRPWQPKDDKKKGPAEGSVQTNDGQWKPVLKPKDVADSYNKVRRADFIGSINQDAEDKAKKIARLWLAMYRDSPAEVYCEVKQDLNRMIFADLTDPLNRPDSPEMREERARKQKMKNATTSGQPATPGQQGLV
jgi:hypothetical protein